MKKDVTRTINIEIEFEPLELVESSVVIHDRPKLPKDQRYSDQQLQWYNDLINSIYSTIEDYAGFTIVEGYQSSQSYSYYIEFEAFTEDGQSLGNFNVKFRISDHFEPAKQKDPNKANTHRARQIRSLKKKIFRTIFVNKVFKSGMFETVDTVQYICDELLAGNIDVLDELIG